MCVWFMAALSAAQAATPSDAEIVAWDALMLRAEIAACAADSAAVNQAHTRARRHMRLW